MFRQSTIIWIVFLGFVALVTGQGLLALICMLLLLTSWLSQLWDRWSLVRIDYQRQFSQNHAFPEDELDFTIRIANRKPLPLPRLEVYESIPAGIDVLDQVLKKDSQGRSMLFRSTSMRWYEALTWHYRIRCHKRGIYRFGPSELEAGDPFGFNRTQLIVEEPSVLIVYPRLLNSDQLGLLPRQPLGELRARQLIQDPMRTVGVRDYQPSDPLKSIHWNASARVGNLQTRIYETTTANELAIFLDIETFEHYWEGIDEQLVEHLISATATIAKMAIDEGYAVGMYTNSALADNAELSEISPARTPAQLLQIMDILARLSDVSVMPMAQLLRYQSRRLSNSATIVMISATKSEALQATMLDARARGRSIMWIYMGSDTPPALPNIIVKHAPKVQFQEAKL